MQRAGCFFTDYYSAQFMVDSSHLHDVFVIDFDAGWCCGASCVEKVECIEDRDCQPPQMVRFFKSTPEASGLCLMPHRYAPFNSSSCFNANYSSGDASVGRKENQGVGSCAGMSTATLMYVFKTTFRLEQYHQQVPELLQLYPKMTACDPRQRITFEELVAEFDSLIESSKS
eukprot:CAMPEP_0174271216 /NCGR_PEP_ID=MMETSP0439-20130205/47133_1 /TAXON_ID=0 /ORGANISM="Stereomyxa ramosa, Strain Chinc5" /LENGTH=171 /DNA_ID=CAMNT_0015361069 /DNA_START=170 /DNA_END=685 /DNA_ORIENTATION=+